MNTITRVMAADGMKSEKRIGVFQIPKKRFVVVSLVCLLLLSAFGVVYLKDLNRRLFIQYQNLQQEKAQEIVQWGKLLLEQSTWSTQSRIQQIAQRQLDMQVPNGRDIVLVEDRNANETTR